MKKNDFNEIINEVKDIKTILVIISLLLSIQVFGGNKVEVKVENSYENQKKIEQMLKEVEKDRVISEDK